MMQDKDRALVARIAAGETLAGPDEVTPGYRGELLRMMVGLVDSQLAGAAGLAGQINAAPTIADRQLASRMVSEKFGHAGAVLELLVPFGVDPDLYMVEHAWDARIDRSADLGYRRTGGDKRLNVFHYPLQGWLDSLVFVLLMGGASVIQLIDQVASSYKPFAGALASIVAREARHARQSERALELVIERSGNRTRPQAAVAYWWPRVMASFGRADSERMALYVAYGLRRRGNGELLEQWHEETAKRLTALGLEPGA
jgi:ring-1,2-phenylacetyl-CoA epoxidase subunit PaaA